MYQMSQILELDALDNKTPVTVAPFGVDADNCPIFPAGILKNTLCEREIDALDATGISGDTAPWLACLDWLDLNVERFGVREDDLADAINADLMPDDDFLMLDDCGYVLRVPWPDPMVYELLRVLERCDDLRVSQREQHTPPVQSVPTHRVLN